jgi:hypothetical protein
MKISDMKRVANFCMLTLIFLFFFGKTNAQNLPKDGLIAWFPFNGTLKDESGNSLNTFFADNNKGGIPLSQVNNLTDDRNGKAKSAFYFSGDNENRAIKVKLAKSLNLRDRTVALWVNNPSKSITRYSNIFELGYNSEVKQYCSILGDESSYVSQKRDGKISCLIAEGGFVESRSYLNDDNWHHIAVVVNSLNNSYKIYIDGKLDSDSYIPIPIINYSNPYSSNPQKPISEISVNYLVFGNVFRNDPQCSFAGKIDDIGLWNRALSESEIFQLFDNFYTTYSTLNVRTDSRIKQIVQTTSGNINSNTNNSTLNKSANSINNESQLNNQKTETYTWANGDKYVGEWKDGKKNGQGTYTWANGDKYVGEWRDDKKSGQGTYTFNSGLIQEGTYENGYFIQEKKAAIVQTNQSNNNSFKPTYKEIPNSASIIGNPIKIGNLLVAEFDFTEKMNWEDAYNSCFSLGKGWRLPTKMELNMLYNNLNKIGDVANDGYWTSTENGNERAWRQYLFKEGYSYDDVKYGSGYVRAVGNYGVVKIIPSKTKKSNTKVPSGIIDGVSQQDLLNALFADDLKPSSQKLNNSKQSTSASEKKCTYCWKRQKQIRRFDLAKDIYVEDRGDAEMRPGSVLCKDRCGGSGRIVEGAFSSKSLRVCNTCKGSGWIKCNNCKGTSFVK